MALMTEAAVKAELKTIKGWRFHDGKELHKEFTHKNFVGSMAFVTSVALVSERANHHPDILICWSKVSLTLSTHSEGGVTEKDIALAKEINKIS
jgi:4a-hydroxytetrahydrobiopterin dehydratase